MSVIDTLLKALQFNRVRTLATLDKIAQEPDPQRVLGWRPGPGRAHIAWQLMHVGITDGLFATERLVPGTKPLFAELTPRFKGGSTPDDNIPPLAEIRGVLSQTREQLLVTLGRFTDADLTMMPEALRERKLSFYDVLHILCWHEAHHQGQAHLALNLFKNQP